MRKNGRLPVTSLKAHAAEIQEFNALKEKEKTLMAEIETLKKAAKEQTVTEENEKVEKADLEAREKKMQEELEERKKKYEEQEE